MQTIDSSGGQLSANSTLADLGTLSFEQINPVTGPILIEGAERYSNPLPSVLILTAIVVGIATTAVALGLVVRIHEAYDSIEEDEIGAMDGEP